MHNFELPRVFLIFGVIGKIPINLNLIWFTVISRITYSKELPVSDALLPGPQHQVPFSYFIRE